MLLLLGVVSYFKRHILLYCFIFVSSLFVCSFGFLRGGFARFLSFLCFFTFALLNKPFANYSKLHLADALSCVGLAGNLLTEQLVKLDLPFFVFIVTNVGFNIVNSRMVILANALFSFFNLNLERGELGFRFNIKVIYIIFIISFLKRVIRKQEKSKK